MDLDLDLENSDENDEDYKVMELKDNQEKSNVVN